MRDQITNDQILELVEQTFDKLGTRTPSMEQYSQAVKER